MPTLVPSSKYGTIINFYPIIININIDKLANIHLRKFNYEKIFYKKKMAKFNKKEAVIKDL